MADPNPADRNQLKRYWTQPGQPGYIKIRWHTDGDWTRCHRHLRKYVGDSRARRICAQWHFEVNGFWPGSKLNRPGN